MSKWKAMADELPPIGETVLLGRPLDFPSGEGIYCVATRHAANYTCDECGGEISNDFTHWMFPPVFSNDTSK